MTTERKAPIEVWLSVCVTRSTSQTHQTAALSARRGTDGAPHTQPEDIRSFSANFDCCDAHSRRSKRRPEVQSAGVGEDE